jgi:hypothetical protein
LFLLQSLGADFVLIVIIFRTMNESYSAEFHKWTAGTVMLRSPKDRQTTMSKRVRGGMQKSGLSETAANPP